MELYVVRHGETVWNAKGLLQGRADTKLNKNGIAAAKKLGAGLAAVQFEKIFSSPLKRAFDTACLVRGERDIPIIKDERLIEISFGEGEGKSYSEWMSEKSPYRFFFTEPEKYPAPPGGENFESVLARTKNFIQEKIEPLFEKDCRLMIVAHGAVNKGIMCHIQNHGIKDYWAGGLQKNCQASVFEFDGKIWKAKVQ